MTSDPRLLPRTMPRSILLSHLEFILMSVAHEATKDHMDTQGLGHSPWPAGHLRTMLLSGLCCSD